jgi:hypothetical protein
MKTITTPLRNAGFALMLATTAAAFAAPGTPVSTDKAEVSFRNPAGFAEMGRDFGAGRGWLDDLGAYVAQRAARTLPDGQRLLVTITDVQRAGMIRPWSSFSTDMRVVSDTTPPRIDLSFQLVAANGTVLKEGFRQLRDPNFLRRSFLRSGEPLSYEKNLIDDWMRKDFAPPKR